MATRRRSAFVIASSEWTKASGALIYATESASWAPMNSSRPCAPSCDFLVINPDEVLLMVLEDYVSPQDIAAAFESSGLARLVYSGPVTTPWPTLRELIESGQRVVVFLESGPRGGALAPAGLPVVPGNAVPIPGSLPSSRTSPVAGARRARCCS